MTSPEQKRRWAVAHRDRMRAATARWRVKHPTRNRQVDQRARRRRRQVRRVEAAEYRARYPERAAAYRVVRNAVRRGELIRQPCACGKRAQAHHEDYARPLEIQWLCPSCHRRHHLSKPLLEL